MIDTAEQPDDSLRNAEARANAIEKAFHDHLTTDAIRAAASRAGARAPSADHVAAILKDSARVVVDDRGNRTVVIDTPAGAVSPGEAMREMKGSEKSSYLFVPPKAPATKAPSMHTAPSTKMTHEQYLEQRATIKAKGRPGRDRILPPLNV